MRPKRGGTGTGPKPASPARRAIAVIGETWLRFLDDAFGYGRTA